MDNKDPVYFKVFIDYLDAIEPLSDGERGRLFTALLVYAKTGEAPQLSGNERFLFPMMRAQMDRDFAAWRDKNEEIHDVRAKAGQKGGQARASKRKQSQANQANASKAKQIKHKTTDYGLLTTDDSNPPNPPAGGTADFPAEAEPVPEDAEPSPRRKRGARQKDPARSPELNPDEEALLAGYSPGLCEAVRDWFQYKAERRETYGATYRRVFFNKIVENVSKYGADAVAKLVTDSLSKGWQGVAWDNLSKASYGGYPPSQPRKSWSELADEIAQEMGENDGHS